MTRPSAATVAIGSLVSEREFQAQLVELATALGYATAAFRPAMRASGRYCVPVSGSLGAGWPDLTLARPRTATRPGRLLFIECKAEDGRLTAEQRAVHEALRAAGCEVYTWRPSDVDLAAEVLR